MLWCKYSQNLPDDWSPRRPWALLLESDRSYRYNANYPTFKTTMFVSYFSSKGKLAPGPYWKIMTVSFAASTLGAWWFIAAGVSLVVGAFQDKPHSLTSILLALGMPAALTVLFSWVLCNVVIQRLHDAGQSGWWSLLMFLPSGSLIVPIVAGVLPQVAEPRPMHN